MIVDRVRVLTSLQRSCLNVVAELTAAGEPPTTAEAAVELDVAWDLAHLTLNELTRAGLVHPCGSRRWRSTVEVSLPPEPEFIIVGEGRA